MCQLPGLGASGAEAGESVAFPLRRFTPLSVGSGVKEGVSSCVSFSGAWDEAGGNVFLCGSNQMA